MPLHLRARRRERPRGARPDDAGLTINHSRCQSLRHPNIFVDTQPTVELIDYQHLIAADLYMTAPPLDANAQFITVMATGMPFIGRG